MLGTKEIRIISHSDPGGQLLGERRDEAQGYATVVTGFMLCVGKAYLRTYDCVMACALYCPNSVNKSLGLF